MRKLFGTDGVRGTANIHPMTSEVALALGQAVAYLFKKTGRHPKIVIGKDTRLSGYMLELALAAGICSMGVEAQLVGPMPTPGIAFLTRAMRADAGAVISASHNPYQDNGIKFFDHEGFKLPDEQEATIEAYVSGERTPHATPIADQIGKAHRIEDARGRYIEFLKSCFPAKLNLEGVKVVLDCAHGAAYQIAPVVLEELGATVITLNAAPDGCNINADCGALHPEGLGARVREEGAALGIALDGDADRAVFCDGWGRLIDGDAVLAICARDLKARGRLAADTVVATVMSNLALEELLRGDKIRLVRTAVGDRYVVQEMRRGGFTFGGEASGHLVFLDHSTTGDGMIAALELLAVMVAQGRTAAELAATYEPYPQVLVNVRVKERKKLDTVPRIASEMARMERDLAGEGRLLVRYSGTEPLIRIMMEGKRRERIDILARELANTIEKELR